MTQTFVIQFDLVNAGVTILQANQDARCGLLKNKSKNVACMTALK